MQRGNSDSIDYCVYVLTDPRKEGEFVYGSTFRSPEEPFYVGQGSLHRPYAHLVEATRSKVKNHKLNKIRRILREYESYTITYVAIGIPRGEALRIEREYILAIGRADLGKGPLANLTDGGDGGSGVKTSQETRRKRSKAARLMHANRSADEKRTIYSRAAASRRDFNSGLSLEERRNLVARMTAGKQESIRRIHQGYLRILTSALLKVYEYLTFDQLRSLLPTIPYRTLLKIIKEYEREGWITAQQDGANRPKRYLYNLWQ